MIPDAQVPKLKQAAVELKKMLRPESEEDARIVQKGLMLYRQGLVHHVKFIGGTVWATVQDVTPVRVYVNLSDPEESTCTCPAYGFCRHRMATFFQAYGQVDSVSDWVDEWRKPAKESLEAEKWGLKKAKDLLKNRQSDTQDYRGWVEEFENNFEEIVLGQGNPTPYVIANLFQAYLRQIRASAPLKQEWRSLYELVGYLYAFKQLTALSVKLEHSDQTVDRYYRYLFETIEEDIDDLIATLSVHSLPFDFDPFIEELRRETAELVEHEDGFHYERMNLYRLMWSHLLKSPSWRDEERHRLEAFGEGRRTQAEEVALAHQYFLSRRDKDTLDHLRKLGLHTLPFTFYWIQELISQGDNNRAGDYIEYMTQHIRAALAKMDRYHQARDFTRYALRTAAPYFRTGGREDLYEKMLAQTLPYSFIEYEDFLFAKEQYAKWGELYTYANEDSLSVPNDKIKIVQKADPEVLLPILHQTVDRLIAQKNRASYKQAVRLLKKLRTIYKKLKRVPEWETFFATLLDRNKRLRAFHAECERGKLIEPKVVEN
ncbi:SWIM zinc finger family protein [Mesobacillus maritimus]|uniref:SWIM zinc finger family protein n=1 Tax=Mesobacillus maritimus TaxID=1643336 RepID=UPI00203AE585|nr:SWIM zinc finger family protein [Mesobacillus maritimus]MCM3586924.1 SWIM zinc finger family protein [Mesobacillus maritimus]MCM3668721.1 SWIM zinc finger family protein [Mesobacillus maritimus]